MKLRFATALAVAAGIAGCGGEAENRSGVAALATCLNERGWVLYGSATCSACRAQKKSFGAAALQIPEIECHPRMPGAQVELCIEREIRVTPTWLREHNGEVSERLEGYQPLEGLAAASGCPF